MTHPHIICPPAGALACVNCSAWSNWDSIGVGQDGPHGFVVIGCKPTGQCRANPPTTDPDAIAGDNAAWPVVVADQWCRAFEMRDQNEEAA